MFIDSDLQEPEIKIYQWQKGTELAKPIKIHIDRYTTSQSYGGVSFFTSHDPP